MVTECPFNEGDIIHRTNFLGEEHILRVTPHFINTVWHYSGGEFGEDRIFIQIEGDGEGMECDPKELEKAIAEFYDENF